MDYVYLCEYWYDNWSYDDGYWIGEKIVKSKQEAESWVEKCPSNHRYEKFTKEEAEKITLHVPLF